MVTKRKDRGGVRSLPLRDNGIVTKGLMHELQDPEKDSWVRYQLLGCFALIDSCVLNLRASPGVLDGNDTLVSSVESCPSGWLDADGAGFLYLSGIDIVSSRSKLSAMFSNIVSIFAMTSASADRCVDAIVDYFAYITFTLRSRRLSVGHHKIDRLWR